MRAPIRLLDLLPLGAAAWLVTQILWVWAGRLPYAYDLEWMEGGMLAHAWRLQQGLPLYVRPSADFIPYIYPPGYSSVLAALGVGGLSPALGRAVSIVGTLTAAALLAVGVARQGSGRVVGLLAAACFLGCYSASGGFYDLVRPDGLYMALVAGAVVAGLERSRGAPVAAGLLLAAAFSVKHNAAIFGFPLLFGILARDGVRGAVQFVLASAVPAGLLTLGLQVRTDGLFLTYLLGVPGSHPTVFDRILPGVPAELMRTLPVPMALGGLWIVSRTRSIAPQLHDAALWLPPAVGAVLAAAIGLQLAAPRGVETDRVSIAIGFAVVGAAIVAVGVQAVVLVRARHASWRWVFGVGVATTALVSAALMRGHFGGFLNVYIPLHWVACFGLGIAAGRMRHTGGAAAVAFTALAFTAQLVFLDQRDDRSRLVPTEADVAAGDEVVRALAESCEGEVWSPYAVWLPTYAGFAPHGHLIALWDVNHETGPLYADLSELRSDVADGWFGCIVEGGRTKLKQGVQDNYRTIRRLPLRGNSLTPKTGWRVRPTLLLGPK
ncbi:MAG: hypothetical protein ACI8PZ_003453 [Myxococcota bacterium]|jgi:hypothetical protein